MKCGDCTALALILKDKKIIATRKKALANKETEKQYWKGVEDCLKEIIGQRSMIKGKSNV